MHTRIRDGRLFCCVAPGAGRSRTEVGSSPSDKRPLCDQHGGFRLLGRVQVMAGSRPEVERLSSPNACLGYLVVEAKYFRPARSASSSGTRDITRSAAELPTGCRHLKFVVRREQQSERASTHFRHLGVARVIRCGSRRSASTSRSELSGPRPNRASSCSRSRGGPRGGPTRECCGEAARASR